MPIEFEDEQENSEIIAYLRGRDFSDEDITKIVAKMKFYDEQMRHKAVFDSIEEGGFNLEQIIREALEES